MIRIISFLLLSFIFSYGVAQNTKINFGPNTTCQYTIIENGTPQLNTVTFSKPNASAAPKATIQTQNGPVNITPSAETFETGMNLKLNTGGAITETDNLFWISNARFYEISMGKTMFYINGTQNMFGLATVGKENIQLKLNGTMVSTEAYHLKSVGNGPALEMWVLNNAANPIVLKTSGAVNVQLNEITY